MRRFASSKNRHLPLLFLLFCRHRRHVSFPHDVTEWTTRRDVRFGPEAAKPTALMPMRTLFSLVGAGIANCLVWYLTYSYVGHNPQQEQKDHRCVVARVVNCSRYGAPLATPPHSTVTQHVELLSNAAAPGVGHHGGRRTTAAATVDGGVF